MSAPSYVIAFSRISDDEQKTYCFYYCFYSVKTNLLDPSSSILHRIVFYALSNRMFHIFCRIVSLARNTYKTAVITISTYTRIYQSRFIANVYGNRKLMPISSYPSAVQRNEGKNIDKRTRSVIVLIFVRHCYWTITVYRTRKLIFLAKNSRPRVNMNVFTRTSANTIANSLQMKMFGNVVIYLNFVNDRWYGTSGPLN